MVSRIKDWSTTPADNDSAPPYGAPENGTNVNQFNNIVRQMMADIREWFETPQWRDLGHTPTYASSTSFTIPGDVTASYIVGQPIRISDTGTLYGVIATSSYSAPNTTITVTLDSGSVSASISAIAVGIDPTNDPIPAIAIRGQLSSGNMPTLALVPTGAVYPFAGSSAPTGYLLCYGQAVSRTTYADLFSAIGTSFGTGDGTTTFNLPDLRGRSVFGVDNMGGSAANRITSGTSGITGTTLGAAGGDERMHQHTHSVTDPGHTHEILAGIVGGNRLRGDTQGTTISSSTQSATTGISIQNAGSGSSQNVPPAMMLNYIIKT